MRDDDLPIRDAHPALGCARRMRLERLAENVSTNLSTNMYANVSTNGSPHDMRKAHICNDSANSQSCEACLRVYKRVYKQVYASLLIDIAIRVSTDAVHTCA